MVLVYAGLSRGIVCVIKGIYNVSLLFLTINICIVRYLAKTVGCYGVLATHFHELITLADEIPTVVNYHVTAVTGKDNLTMLYKIEKGPCDRR